MGLTRKIYIILLVTFKRKGEVDSFMKESIRSNSAITEGIACLSKDRIGYIIQGSTASKREKNQVMVMISYPDTRVSACAIKTSKSFLTGAFDVLQVSAKGFLDKKQRDKVKSTIKIKNGMCKMIGKIAKSVKIEYSFPVDDYESWGKADLTIEDWKKIVAELR